MFELHSIEYSNMTRVKKKLRKRNFRQIHNSNNLMDRSLFDCSNKDVQSNSHASKKIVE